jgi:hypothetical protein
MYNERRVYFLGVKQPGVTLITQQQSGAEVKERVDTPLLGI